MIRCSKPGPTTSCWPSSAAMSLSKASRSVRYGFGGLHQPVEIVVGKAQSQLIERGHGKLHTKNCECRKRTLVQTAILPLS